MKLQTESLQTALQEARDHYRSRRPRSARLASEAASVLPGGNTRTVLYHEPFPIFFERGHGSRLDDADGHSYVNLLGEYTAGIFGHDHPVIREAIIAALDHGMNLSGHTESEMRLAGLIRHRFPGMELLRFTNSGTEANIMAVQAARWATGRERVLVFSGGYHGGVLAFGRNAGQINIPFPITVGRYNDVRAAREAIRAHADDLACVLVEPMLGSGGCIPASREFLQALCEEAGQCGAVCIFDEVMTSRLSAGGAQGLHGVVPDLTTLGKYIGGGMSFGAFGGRRDLMAVFDPRRSDAVAHAGTFNNNVLTMSAGAAALENILAPDVLNALNERGDRLRDALNERFMRAGAPMQATGAGSLMNIHTTGGTIRSYEDTAQADESLKELFFLDMLDRGHYMARRGFIALSIALSDDELSQFLDAVSDFLRSREALLQG